MLHEKLRRYALKDTFNGYYFGLNYRMDPDISVETERLPARKKGKERILALALRMRLAQKSVS